jgi:hypothetical protein
VQTAMHAMMADRAIDTVDAIASSGTPIQTMPACSGLSSLPWRRKGMP